MIVIILNGPGESGKGTFVEILMELYKCRLSKYSSITWAKHVAKNQFGWHDGNKLPEKRAMIGEIHQLGIKYGNIPFNKVIGHYLRAKGMGAEVFVTDVREPTEIQKYVDRFKAMETTCLTIRIANIQKEQYAAKNLGIADNQYLGFDYDFVIPNDGSILDFKRAIAIKLHNKIDLERRTD